MLLNSWLLHECMWHHRYFPAKSRSNQREKQGKSQVNRQTYQAFDGLMWETALKQNWICRFCAHSQRIIILLLLISKVKPTATCLRMYADKKKQTQDSKFCGGTQAACTMTHCWPQVCPSHCHCLLLKWLAFVHLVFLLLSSVSNHMYFYSSCLSGNLCFPHFTPVPPLDLSSVCLAQALRFFVCLTSSVSASMQNHTMKASKTNVCVFSGEDNMV